MNLRVPENFGYSIFAKLTYFIAAERTGNWQNHLGSTAKMLILLAARGHSNYAKSACKAIFANDERIAYRIS